MSSCAATVEEAGPCQQEGASANARHAAQAVDVLLQQRDRICVPIGTMGRWSAHDDERVACDIVRQLRRNDGEAAGGDDSTT